MRKLEVVRVPPSSATVLLSCHPESPLRAQIFEERKKVAAFVDTEQAGQSRYRQPVQGVGQH